MQRRSYRLLFLLALGLLATCGHCEDVAGEEENETAAPVTVAEMVDELAPTERTDHVYRSGCRCANVNCPTVNSDGLEESDCEQCCLEEQLTTVTDQSGDESTTEQSDFTMDSTTTTTSTSTTTTTTPAPRTHGRMVRFGAGKRRMSRPTTTEPQRRTTANSRTVLNRRGLFNPELRNRYLGRFRSTTAAPDI